MTIEEQNELIAQYMNHWNAYKTVNTKYGVSNAVDRITVDKIEEYKEDGWRIDTEEYDNSWDAIMPVLRKVLNEVSNKSNIGTSYHREGIRENIWDAIQELEIEPLYKEIVSAIQWINNQKASGPTK